MAKMALNVKWWDAKRHCTFDVISGEIAPATAFMTGKIKISGDLTKALTLEKVMVAAREAREKQQGWNGITANFIQ